MKILTARIGSIEGKMYVNEEKEEIDHIIFTNHSNFDESAIILYRNQETSNLGECMIALSTKLDKFINPFSK